MKTLCLPQVTSEAPSAGRRLLTDSPQIIAIAVALVWAGAVVALFDRNLFIISQWWVLIRLLPLMLVAAGWRIWRVACNRESTTPPLTSLLWRYAVRILLACAALPILLSAVNRIAWGQTEHFCFEEISSVDRIFVLADFQEGTAIHVNSWRIGPGLKFWVTNTRYNSDFDTPEPGGMFVGTVVRGFMGFPVSLRVISIVEPPGAPAKFSPR